MDENGGEVGEDLVEGDRNGIENIDGRMDEMVRCVVEVNLVGEMVLVEVFVFGLFALLVHIIFVVVLFPCRLLPGASVAIFLVLVSRQLGALGFDVFPLKPARLVFFGLGAPVIAVIPRRMSRRV